MTTIDRILLCCAVFLILFVITMIVLFCFFQSVPDSLIDAVFGLAGGEAVITFVIWYIKKRMQKK